MTAEAYDQYMGTWSRQLSQQFADFAGLRTGALILDVGCGPGILSAELAARLGAGSVTAVDPSPQFVAVARQRIPGIDVRQAAAENLPFPSATFDITFAQLVVHLMNDPVTGLAEMARVTARGGIIAACVWNFGDGHGPLGPFWAAARELDADVQDESSLPGVGRGHLVQLFEAAGIEDLEGTVLRAVREYASFADWWAPFTLGVGPGGAHVARLTTEEATTLRDRCRTMLPDGPFVVTAEAWAVRGVRAES